MSSFTGTLDTRWLDDDRFQVLSPYRFDFGEKGSGVGIYVPEGTITDLMSLPWLLRLAIRRTTSGSIASVPHDIAYKTAKLQKYTVDPDSSDPTPLSFDGEFKIDRSTADLMILDALLTRGMAKPKAYSVWSGLAVGGWVAWNRYRNIERAAR